MSTQIEYITFRHAQHAPSKHDELFDELGLTASGIGEARQIGKSINGATIDKSYSFKSKRALSTVALSLNNELPIYEVPEYISNCHQSGKLEAKTELDYLPIYPSEYQDRLFASYAENRQMAFTIYESDKLQSEEKPVSTYSTMAKKGIEEVLYHFEECDYRRVASCAREFIFPSVIAKILEEQAGIEAVDDYVQWYIDNIEAQNTARLRAISFKKRISRSSERVEVSSDYGQIIINYEKFKSIASNINV